MEEEGKIASVTKEALEKAAEVTVSDEFWAKCETMLHGEVVGGKVFQMVLMSLAELSKEKAELSKEKAKNIDLSKKINDLNAELKAQSKFDEKEKQFLVLSASTAANDSEVQKNFRRLQVGKHPCRGGFIAHAFYLDFVLATRKFEGMKIPEPKYQEVLGAVQALGEKLKNRVKNSLLNHSYVDEEGPQSAIAAELFQVAVDSLQEKDKFHVGRLRVTHQQQLVHSIVGERHFEILRKRKKKDETDEDKDTKKSDDRIDICVWFFHPGELGACVLASGVYKPFPGDVERREMQAEMYGSNIWILHQKPCIVFSIAGGRNLSEWEVTAYGLVSAQFSSGSHSLEKTPLYKGHGAEAIVMVAWGLTKAQKNFPNQLKDDGERLGPVVGVIGKHIYKVYDCAETRKPNVDVIRALLDDDAALLSSDDKNLQIVKMKKFDSDWKKPVSTAVFRSIIGKLQELHNDFGVHGDIRLANLLSSGHIIDFDFVRAESYPCTLQELTQDGARHEEVLTMIHRMKTNGKEEKLKPQKRHDWYSLGQVMKLFDPVLTDEGNGHLRLWEAMCKNVEEGQAIDDEKWSKFYVRLKDDSIPLQGTGHTPPREKLPTKKHLSTVKKPKKMDTMPESATDY